MEATSLRKMAVISIADAAKIGEVDDLLVNVNTHRITALRLKASPPYRTAVIPVREIYRVGKDAITLESSRRAEGTLSDEEGIAESEDIVSLGKLLGVKVLSRSGNLLGTLSEVNFESSNFQITGYQVSSGGLAGLTGGRKTVRANPEIHYGKDILMVPDEETAAMDEDETQHRSEAEDPKQPGRY